MDYSQTQIIKKHHILWFLLIVVCIVTGFSANHINPIFIILGIIGLVNIILMVKYSFWALLVYLIVYMIRPAEIMPMLAPLRLELLVGSFAIIITIVKEKLSNGSITFPLDKIWLSLFLILLTIYISLFGSYEKTETFNAGVAFIKIIVFVFLIISIIDTKERFTFFVTCYVILMTYIATDALIAYLGGDFVHTMNVDRIKGTTSAGGDPNALGATIVTTIPLVTASIIYYKHKLIKAFFILTIGLFIWVLIITASRSGMVALLSMIFIEIMYSKKRVILLVCACFLLVGGWFILPEQYQNRYARFSDVGESETLNKVSSGRIEIWMAGLKMIGDYPITGVGAKAFPWAYASGEFGPSEEYYSHNLYIEIMASMGIIGLAAWLAFLLSFLSRLKLFFRTKFDQSNVWIKAYAKSFIVIIISLLFSGMFGHNLFKITWFMLAGLTICLTDIYRQRNKSFVNTTVDRITK